MTSKSTESGDAQPRSIYDRAGGRKAVEAVVEEFYRRVLSDPALKDFFTNIDMPWLKGQQADFFCQALGGPAAYKGRGMRDAHAGMGVKPAHFQLVAKHLSDALLHLGVPAPLTGEVIALVATLQKDIVAA